MPVMLASHYGPDFFISILVGFYAAIFGWMFGLYFTVQFVIAKGGSRRRSLRKAAVVAWILWFLALLYMHLTL